MVLDNKVCLLPLERLVMLLSSQVYCDLWASESLVADVSCPPACVSVRVYGIQKKGHKFCLFNLQPKAQVLFLPVPAASPPRPSDWTLCSVTFSSVAMVLLNVTETKCTAQQVYTNQSWNSSLSLLGPTLVSALVAQQWRESRLGILWRKQWARDKRLWPILLHFLNSTLELWLLFINNEYCCCFSS